MPEKKLFLLDAYALAYRSYYAFIKNPRINSKGENTSAVFGFTNTLLEVIKKQKPSHIGVVFDPAGPNFRHEMYEAYKANRETMPDDMRQSIPYIKEMIEAMNIPVVEVKGFEADDVIGTLAKKAANEGFQVFMMTPDKDYAQLVTDKVFVFKPAQFGNEAEIWDEEKVIEKFSVPTHKIIDLLGLMGDSSDNIPGCPGIGPKSAEKLIATYGSLEGVYEHIEELKGKQKENLINFREQIELSKVLATIDVNVPVEFNSQHYILEEPNEEKIKELFDRLEFRTLLTRIIPQQAKVVTNSKEPVQGSLFDVPESDTPDVHEELKTILTEQPEYLVVDSEKAQLELVQELMNASQVCFDTETTSLETHSAQLVGMSFAIKKGKAWYIPFPEEEDQVMLILNRFRSFFESQTIVKVGQNIKYDMLVLMNYGIHLAGPYFDTMIAHYLIQPELRHNLDDLAKNYLKYKTIYTEELIGKKGKNQLNMRNIPLGQIKDYAAEDADITMQLVPLLKSELEKSGMVSLFETIEMPLIPVLATIEFQGVSLDTPGLKEYAKQLNEEILEVEQEIYRLAGFEFNISSPKQLGEILFDRLKIVADAKKTKTKQYATAEDVLSKLKDKHPIINQILDYRSLKKLLSTYIEVLPTLIHPKTKKIHTSYNQTIAATGRLSSNNPNLQNIPIREARGREIRKAFIPSDENHLFLSADYSQIELRLMAHLSNDQNMIEAFKNGEDIHAATAARIFKIPLHEVSREQRSKAKGANFGIIYGISSFGLSQNINISRTEAKEIIDNYFTSYPDVKLYMDKSIERVRKFGYAETLFGRRRYLDDIHSNNAIVRGAAERNAINAPIQGSAADIIKIAMIAIQKHIEQEGLQSKMILQVHDELVFDVLKSELDLVKEMVKQEMERAVVLNVPLVVDSGTGNNWLEAH